jgi:formate dehydrogenase major subunit
VGSDRRGTPRERLASWPALRQLTGADRLGRGSAVRSAETDAARPRTADADRVVQSVCPYCAVGCGQQVFIKNIGGRDTVTQIEGDPDSPVSRGRLCPKGAASKQLVTHSGRQDTVLYRRPHGTSWEPLPLATAMDMIAERVLATRRRTWQENHQGQRVNRTLGFASLGGATLDNEENYLIKKLWSALGAIQIENQARI